MVCVDKFRVDCTYENTHGWGMEDQVGRQLSYLAARQVVSGSVFVCVCVQIPVLFLALLITEFVAVLSQDFVNWMRS